MSDTDTLKIQVERDVWLHGRKIDAGTVLHVEVPIATQWIGLGYAVAVAEKPEPEVADLPELEVADQPAPRKTKPKKTTRRSRK